jgi:hypothetical protein
MRAHFRHLRPKAFQWYNELLNLMSFDPLKIRKSIWTTTPKMRIQLGVWGIPSHFLHFREYEMWFLGFTFGLHLCKPLLWSRAQCKSCYIIANYCKVLTWQDPSVRIQNQHTTMLVIILKTWINLYKKKKDEIEKKNT